MKRSRGIQIWSIALIVVALAWLAVNKRIWEGSVLLELTPHHGLTEADVPSLVAVAAGAYGLWHARRLSPGR